LHSAVVSGATLPLIISIFRAFQVTVTFGSEDS
jgi:hypothetical protein